MDWTKPFTASYRLVRVSRSTLLELGTLPNAVLAGSTITRNVDTADYESASIKLVGSVDVGSDLVRVYLDATSDDGETESVALGTFLVETPKRDVTGPLSEWSAKLVGRLAEVGEDEYERPVTIPAGTNAVQEAANIFLGCGLEVVADESDWTLTSDWVVGMGGGADEPTDKLGVANRLLGLAGFGSAITDGYGRAVLRRYRDPADRAASFTFREGPSARFLSQAEDERDVTDVANVVVVVYSTQDEDTIGTAYDDDPRSPYSTATLGRRKVKRYSYQDGATQAQADAKAAELLRTQQSVIHRVTLSHVYAPVTCTDVVGVEWPTAGISDTFAIRTQSIQLGAGCLTKSELRRFERGTSMADLDLQSLGMRLGEAITPTPRDAPQVRYGTIDAVNADGTLDVAIDGTTLRGMCATTGCVGAQAGMRCIVLRQGPLATVVGLIASHGLQNVWLPNSGTIIGHDTDGNAREAVQVTNANNNIAFGWGGWEASQGSTNLYGNDMHITTRNKPTINGAPIGVDWNYNNTGWSVMYRQDGLVELRKDVTASLTYSAWGSMYEAAISDFQAYPWTFSTRPSTHVEIYYLNGSGIACIEYSPSTTQTTHFTKIWALRPTTASGSSIGCTLVAVGRKP